MPFATENGRMCAADLLSRLQFLLTSPWDDAAFAGRAGEPRPQRTPHQRVTPTPASAYCGASSTMRRADAAEENDPGSGGREGGEGSGEGSREESTKGNYRGDGVREGVKGRRSDRAGGTTATAAPTGAWRRKRTPSSSNHSVDFVLPPREEDACEGDIDGDNDDDRYGDDDPSVSGSPSNKTTHKKLTYKRSLSSLAPPTEYDTQLLKRAVADAGRWAYGIVLVEVWALNDDRTFLSRPDHGFWIDPAFHNNPNCRGCPMCKLIDPSHPDYVPPQRQSPGQGLPGVLWSEVAQSWTRSFRETLADKILGKQQHNQHTNPKKVPGPPTLSPGGGSGGSSSHNSFLEPYGIHINTSHFSTHIVWRSIPQLESDPDQPWNPRLQLLASLGLGWAAAVPFNLHGDQGIVVYVARDNVDLPRLRSESNEAYLVSASDLIAAAYALRGPRQRVVYDRHWELARTLRIVRRKIVELHQRGINLKEYVDHNAGGGPPTEDAAVAAGVAGTQEGLQRRRNRVAPTLHHTTKAVKGAVRTSLRKARGGGAPIPPPFGWKQSILTFVGSFATLLAITALSDHFSTKWGPDYGIVLGPFGASMTLLYGLTAAPASQPRNVILGQIFSMAIAVSVSYLSVLPVWLRQSFGAALAIMCMVKLGVTHPPAGATALILTTTISDSTRNSWFNMATSLLGNVIAVVMATFINNLSVKRQYPIYWGLSWSELVQPMKEVASALQARMMPVLAAACRFCSCHALQGRTPRRGRQGHHHPHNHRRGGSPATLPRPSRRVGLEEDPEEGSAEGGG